MRFKNLSIEAEAYVGSRGLPTLINSTMNTIEVLGKKEKSLIKLYTKIDNDLSDPGQFVSIWVSRKNKIKKISYISPI